MVRWCGTSLYCHVLNPYSGCMCDRPRSRPRGHQRRNNQLQPWEQPPSNAPPPPPPPRGPPPAGRGTSVALTNVAAWYFGRYGLCPLYAATRGNECRMGASCHLKHVIPVDVVPDVEVGGRIHLDKEGMDKFLADMESKRIAEDNKIVSALEAALEMERVQRGDKNTPRANRVFDSESADLPWYFSKYMMVI